MQVAVTGAAGFLGAHVVRALAASGHAVRALLRPGGDRRNLASQPVAVVEGDLATLSVPEGFPGDAAFLIHLAAVYSERAGDRELLFRVNSEAVDAVLEAARRDGVRRVVHVSTMGTCAPASHGGPATEEDRPAPGSPLSAYARSKIEGERRALAARDLEVVVVNPAALVGAFDLGPGVTGLRILEAARGVMPHLMAGPVNHVPAAACARGILLVAERGRPGTRYLLGGENLGPEAFLGRVARAAGRPPARRTLLDHLLQRRRPCPGNLMVDDSRARRELGYEPGDLDAAFREALADFRRRGLL